MLLKDNSNDDLVDQVDSDSVYVIYYTGNGALLEIDILSSKCCIDRAGERQEIEIGGVHQVKRLE